MLSCFRTRLDKVYALLSTPFIHLDEVNLRSKIFLTTQQQIGSIRDSFLGHLIPCLFDSFPTLFFRKVENQNNAITRFKVSGNNAPISFLAGSIPDAESDCFITDCDLFVSEVNSSNSYIKRFLVFDVSPENRGLACSTLSDEDDFVSELLRMVVLGRHLVSL